MSSFKTFAAFVTVLALASSAIADKPQNVTPNPQAATPATEETSTIRELVGRLGVHGVATETIEKRFGKPVAELNEGDIPRLQQGLEKLRAKIDPQSDGGDADFAGQKRQTRANIELWETRVRAKLSQVDRIVSGLDLRQIQVQKMTVDSLIAVLDQLDEEARSIIAANEQVQPDLRLYKEALLKAPGVFRTIATNFEHKATEHKSALLKAAYADFGAESRKLATKYEAQAAGIGSLEGELSKKIAVVQESREFIADVRELLKAVPASHGIQTQKLVERLNVYIDVLRQAIDSIKGAAGRIGEPQSPSSEEPRTVPLTRTGGPADGVSSYQSERAVRA